MDRHCASLPHPLWAADTSATPTPLSVVRAPCAGEVALKVCAPPERVVLPGRESLVLGLELNGPYRSSSCAEEGWAVDGP